MTEAEVTAIAIKWSNSRFVAMSDRFVQDFAREILAAAKVDAAQPDCRTCEKYRVGFCSTEYEKYDCTNGDQYKPTKPLKLWKGLL